MNAGNLSGSPPSFSAIISNRSLFFSLTSIGCKTPLDFIDADRFSSSSFAKFFRGCWELASTEDMFISLKVLSSKLSFLLL